jgi:hypothetical protein
VFGDIASVIEVPLGVSVDEHKNARTVAARLGKQSGNS